MNLRMLAASFLVLCLLSHVVIAQPTVTVVMSGLDNPRGLALGPDGGIYVAETGRGGTGTEIMGGEGVPVQFGASGAVSRYLIGTQQRVISGLPSLASQTGTAPGGHAAGLNDMAFGATGELFGIIGLGGDPAKRATLGSNGTHFGQLVRLPIGGTPQNIADVGTFEATNNPDGGVVDTNPFALITTPTGFVVADAGGNSLVSVTPAGVVSTKAVFPNRPNPLPFGPPTYQAVPTSVTIGPDGAYYVGQLTGFPFPQGGSNVLRVDPVTGAQTTAHSGFTNVIDLAFGPDNDLYVLQLTTNGIATAGGPGPGRLIHIDADTGLRTTLLESPLSFPGDLLLAPDGAIYISNKSDLAGVGEVLRIVVPEPATGLLITLGLAFMSLSRRRRRN